MTQRQEGQGNTTWPVLLVLPCCDMLSALQANRRFKPAISPKDADAKWGVWETDVGDFVHNQSQYQTGEPEAMEDDFFIDKKPLESGKVLWTLTRDMFTALSSCLRDSEVMVPGNMIVSDADI